MIRWTCASRGILRYIHSSTSSASTIQGIQTKFDLPDPTQSSKTADGGWVPRLTKIVATIGPTSEQLPVLQEVRDKHIYIRLYNVVCNLHMYIISHHHSLLYYILTTTGRQEWNAHHAIEL